jgi:aspartyl-tRNA(Asn)/glutamyl-tRNA(Gln) amidotransferase subunit B
VIEGKPYTVVIGLEVHVQLRTKSKLFCRCDTKFGASPNTQVCPVCLGLPGSLPVLNRRAVELSLLTGVALHCEIPALTKWDRKQYFYPDLPKGYQISQYDLPICGRGYLEINDPARPNEKRTIRITRAHLEEDAGKSMHDERSARADTRIDLNRTGTPLLEIVSEPDLRTAEEAKEYLTELKLLLTYLDVSDCEMQEGSLRVDANVNLHIPSEGGMVATPIVEIKNMNSFRAVERAIGHEIDRQYSEWRETGRTKSEAPKQTRGWDDVREATFLQREKEESADYRYFPDPDLVPMQISPLQIEEARRAVGELPAAARQRLQTDYQLKPYDVEVLTGQGRAMVAYFDQVVRQSGDARRASAWIQQDVLRTLKERNLSIDGFPLSAEVLGALIGRVSRGELENSRAREVFSYLLDHGGTLEQAISALGIAAVDSSDLENLCRELLAANPKIVQDVRTGNAKALGALVGQAKKKNANANPQTVRELCERLIAQEYCSS